jgi:hypothetical protein
MSTRIGRMMKLLEKKYKALQAIASDEICELVQEIVELELEIEAECNQ